MFVGETGVGRTVQRTCEAMNEAGITDPHDIEAIRALGVIDLPTIQKKANLHISLSLDLFGSELSTNAANAFTTGIKGRYKETTIDDDHQLLNDTYPVLKLIDGALKMVDEPAVSAINARLRDDYIYDCRKGLQRWNKIISKNNIDFSINAPHVAFHRQIGEFADAHVSPQGEVLAEDQWMAQKDKWLPTSGDGEFISSLMKPATGIGEYASWIAPPKLGIDNKPGDYEYVKLD